MFKNLVSAVRIRIAYRRYVQALKTKQNRNTL